MRRKTLFGELLKSEIERAIMKNVMQRTFNLSTFYKTFQVAGPTNGSCFFKSFLLSIIWNQSPHAGCPKMEKGVMR